MHRIIPRVALLLPGIVWMAGGYRANAAPKKSEDNVKITIKADKPVEGKQVVTLNLEVAKTWHLYANPVGNKDLEAAQTVVKFTSGGKPVPAKIEYPEGKVEKDEVIGDYRIYEGTVTIKATLDRKDVAGPVEAAVTLQTCTKTTCLLQSTVKLKVD